MIRSQQLKEQSIFRQWEQQLQRPLGEKKLACSVTGTEARDDEAIMSGVRETGNELVI